MDKGQKASSDKSLLFKFVLIFLILLIFVLIVGTIREYLRQRELDSEMATLKAEIDQLNLDKNQFLSSIDAYKSDFFVEQEARLKFNLQQPGEKVVVIPQDAANNSLNPRHDDVSGQVQNISTKFYVNNVRAWWNYFFQVRSNAN